MVDEGEKHCGEVVGKEVKGGKGKGMCMSMSMSISMRLMSECVIVGL